MTGLLLRDQERMALQQLRERALTAPVDMTRLAKRLATPEGAAAHRSQMTAQSLLIPLDYCVTFSIETGHPGGTARHMSVSIGRPDRVAPPAAIWLIAQELGFVGGLEECSLVYPETLSQGLAVNVVQLVAHHDAPGRA